MTPLSPHPTAGPIVEGWIEQVVDRTPEAMLHYQRAMDFFEATSDYAGLAYAKREFTRHLSSDDDGKSRIEAYRECIDLFQTAGDCASSRFIDSESVAYVGCIYIETEQTGELIRHIINLESTLQCAIECDNRILVGKYRTPDEGRWEDDWRKTVTNLSHEPSLF